MGEDRERGRSAGEEKVNVAISKRSLKKLTLDVVRSPQQVRNQTSAKLEILGRR